MPRINSTNLFGPTPFIVDLAASQGSYTTIQSAIDAAFAAGGGIVYIRKGNYVENLTLRNNVALAGVDTDARAPLADLVVVTGNHTFTGVGECIVQCIHFRSPAGDTFTLLNNVGGNALVLGCKYCLIESTGGRSFAMSDTSGTGFALGVLFSSQAESDLDFAFCGDRSQIQIQENSNVQSTTAHCINLSGANCGMLLEYSEFSCALSTIIFNSATASGTVRYCTLGSSDFAYEFAAAASLSSEHNTIQVTGVAGDYIGGAAAGTYTYADEVLLGANGIAGTISQLPSSWKPYATSGTTITGIRGTAAFDSTDFTVTDGFVELAGAAPYISLDPYIVGQVGDTHAGFTSINSAIAQAVLDGHGPASPANIYIKPGSYTENVAMVAGINLVGFSSGFNASFFSPVLVPETVIFGVITASFSGQAFIKSLALNGVAVAAIVVSTPAGPEPTILNIENCYFSATLAPTVVSTADNAVITLYDCFIQQEGIFGYFNKSGTSELTFERCAFDSLQNTATSNACSDGQVTLNYCNIDTGIIVTGTGQLKARWSEISDPTGLAIDQSSSGQVTLEHCVVSNSVGPSVNIALGSFLQLFACNVSAAASPEITGTGNLQYDHLFGTTALGTVTTVVDSVLPIAGTTSASRGHAYFDPADFSVDADGQVHSLGAGLVWSDQAASTSVTANSGSYVSGAAVTLTLPVGPAQGDICDFCVTTGATPFVIQAAAGQTIQIGTTASSITGTATNTADGDSIHLVFRLATQTWYSIGGAQGTWVLA